MKPWPGRNMTPQRSENELELVLLVLCLVVRASPTHTSLIPRCQHFLQRTVLSVRFLVKLEAPLYFIPFYVRSQAEFANDHILVRRLTPCLFRRFWFLTLLRTCRYQAN